VTGICNETVFLNLSELVYRSPDIFNFHTGIQLTVQCIAHFIFYCNWYTCLCVLVIRLITFPTLQCLIENQWDKFSYTADLVQREMRILHVHKQNSTRTDLWLFWNVDIYHWSRINKFCFEDVDVLGVNTNAMKKTQKLLYTSEKFGAAFGCGGTELNSGNWSLSWDYI
jgi:hypothetical protein